MNRPEVQNKGQGRRKDDNGKSIGPGTSHKGMSRLIRDHKRAEAEERNRRTNPDNRRVHWKAQGFPRKSVAARVVSNAVREANEIANSIREKSGLNDWAPLPNA